MKIIKWVIGGFWLFIIYKIIEFDLVAEVPYRSGDLWKVYVLKLSIFLVALILLWTWEKLFSFTSWE